MACHLWAPTQVHSRILSRAPSQICWYCTLWKNVRLLLDWFMVTKNKKIIVIQLYLTLGENTIYLMIMGSSALIKLNGTIRFQIFSIFKVKNRQFTAESVVLLWSGAAKSLKNRQHRCWMLTKSVRKLPHFPHSCVLLITLISKYVIYMHFCKIDAVYEDDKMEKKFNTLDCFSPISHENTFGLNSW